MHTKQLCAADEFFYRSFDPHSESWRQALLDTQPPRHHFTVLSPPQGLIYMRGRWPVEPSNVTKPNQMKPSAVVLEFYLESSLVRLQLFSFC